MSELKKCPFCGGDAETKMYLWGHHAETHAPIWCYYVYCVSCDAMTDNIFKSKEEAITAWNRRAQPENEALVRCGECAKFQSPNCAAKHEQALMDFCSHGVRKPERSEKE